jgi:hypothetical protein
MKPALFLCLVCLFACGKSEEPAAAAPAAPTPVPVAPAAAPPAEPVPSAEELPVAEDFASEAEQQIDAKSYKAELAKLDHEMTAEAK